MRPRLIFVNRYFWPDQSATAQILSSVAFDLAEQGYDIHVIADRSACYEARHFPSHESHKGVQIHRISTPGSKRTHLAYRAMSQMVFLYRAYRRLLAMASNRDMIIAKTDPPLLSVFAGRAARKRKARLVNWLQDLYPETASVLGVGLARGASGAMLSHWRNHSLQQADTNIVIGEVMVSRLQALGLASSRIRIIPNFADDQAITPIPPDQNRLRSEWGFTPDEMVVAYAGTLGRAHEIETMLEAAGQLRDRADIRFLFIGGGHQREILQRHATEMGLSSFVFRPWQPHNRLSEALAVADLHWLSLNPQLEGCIVPSKAYGVAAAGRGAIMIGHPQGEIARLVEQFSWGYNIAPGDSTRLAKTLRALADHPEKRYALGEAARRFIDTQASRNRALCLWRDLAKSWASCEKKTP